MMIVMNKDASQDDVDKVVNKIKEHGLSVHISEGESKIIIGAIGDRTRIENIAFETFPFVEEIIKISKPYKLASREFQPADTVVDVEGAKVTEGMFSIIAGPCSVESLEQVVDTAKAVASAGARFFRGGAYKPRTSPYTFQGFGEPGLQMLVEAKKETGLPIVTEVMNNKDIETVASYADVIQVGARNMQNFHLLKDVGQAGKPVLLKRAFGCTIEELLMSAEYILNEGNKNVILCERGIRTFETMTRNTLDISAIPLIKELSHLPIIVDPSHGTGKRSLVLPMVLAAMAAGADGALIEVHPDPKSALCDGPQSLDFSHFDETMKEIKRVSQVFGKTV